MVKIQIRNGQFTLTLPTDVMKGLNWVAGDDLYVWKEPGKAVVHIVKNE